MDRITTEYKKKLLHNYINYVTYCLGHWGDEDRKALITAISRIEKCEDELRRIGISTKTIEQILDMCKEHLTIKRIFANQAQVG